MKTPSRNTLADLQSKLRDLAKLPLPSAGFDRDKLMLRVGQAELARTLLRDFFPEIEEDPENVL